MIGSSISHYKITAELGRGGMGIVYQAEDTTLDRIVALKLLPASALTSEDDRARFYREAKAAAALNHPHIAQVYQISEAVPDGGASDEPRPFIAMEFIDGESLEDRINSGPLSLEDAVRIVSQIAQALEAAHEKGIVHRDIKSQNVMLTAKGEAKVLDFGLAQTSMSTKLTRMGSTLGTVAYMSPEQARGEEVNGRTDLWALGVILYELVAGHLPFGGDYEQAVTYSILNEDPQPLTAIRTGVPMGLEWIVAKLLAKKAGDRYQNASDLLVDLRTVDLSSAGLSRTTSVREMPAVSPGRKEAGIMKMNIKPTVWLAIILLAALGGWWIGTGSAPEPMAGSTKRVVQSIPIGPVIAAMDISNDGSLVALATENIRVLNLRTNEMREYDVPEVYVHIAFSPDDKLLLLTTSTELKILSLDSGSVIELGETIEGGPRAEWIDTESIVYEDDTSLFERSLTTGISREVIELDSLALEYDADFPIMLPDGKTLMATGQTRNAPNWLGFWDLKSGELKNRIDVPAMRAQWMDPGHLVFILDGDIVAMPFDLNTLTQRGPLVPLDQDVRAEGMAVSKEGTLIHAGTKVGVVNDNRPIKPIIMRLTGASVQMESPKDLFPSAIYRSAVIGPDGKKVAVVIEGEDRPGDNFPQTDIWILDFESGNRRIVTTGGISDYPAWSVTGDSLYFVRENDGNNSIMVKAASGRGAETTVLDTAIPALFDLTLSPDGRYLAFAGGIPPSKDMASSFGFWDLQSERRLLVNGTDVFYEGPNGNPRYFDYSPDGKYLAYEDQGAIFVMSTEDRNSPPMQIWENGMTLPRWAKDGTELYVRDVVTGAHGIQVQTEPIFSMIGQPINYSQYMYVLTGSFFDTFDLKGRFLGAYPDADAESDVDPSLEQESIDLHMVINLTNELRGDK